MQTVARRSTLFLNAEDLWYRFIFFIGVNIFFFTARETKLLWNINCHKFFDLFVWVMPSKRYFSIIIQRWRSQRINNETWVKWFFISSFNGTIYLFILWIKYFWCYIFKHIPRLRNSWQQVLQVLVAFYRKLYSFLISLCFSPIKTVPYKYDSCESAQFSTFFSFPVHLVFVSLKTTLSMNGCISRKWIPRPTYFPKEELRYVFFPGAFQILYSNIFGW